MIASTTLGNRYRIVAPLGAGGMADVYEAEDLLLERRVALKILRAGSSEAARRFRAEMLAQATVSHPSIVRLFDAGIHEETPYLVMELIHGRPLSRLLEEGPLPPRHVATIGRDLAEALAAAHGAGVVHRDVKPSNVLVDDGGTAHLADFGIARVADATRLTISGATMGTAGYVAPEQVEGLDAGAPADVYALGLVLLEALTGRPAYPGRSVEAAAARLTRPPDIPADLPAPWRRLINAMTERDPAAREDVSTVPRVLAGIADPERTEQLPARRQPTEQLPTAPAFGPPTSDARPPRQRSGRSPRSAARRPRGLAIGVGVAVLLALAGWGLTRSPAPLAPTPAAPATAGAGPTQASSPPATLDDALRRLEEAISR